MFFLFFFFFWDWKKMDRPQTLLGWLESKMRLESFYIWVKLRFQRVHVWCLESGRKGVDENGYRFLRWLWWGWEWGGGSVCLCSVCVWPSGRFSDGHSFGWPLPRPGRCPAGTRSWASWATPAVGDSQEKRFVYKVITWLLLPLCHTHLLLLYLLLCCVPYFTCIHCNILDPDVTTAYDAKMVIYNYLTLEVKELQFNKCGI